MRHSLRTVHAFAELCRYDLLNAIAGFRANYRSLRRLGVAGKECCREVSENEIDRAIHSAVRMYWKPVRCLQRSVVAARLLRRCGLPAEVVIGCRPVPFMSHAWVEIQGRAQRTLPAFQKRLLVLERIGFATGR
jgi:hypothetical protein